MPVWKKKRNGKKAVYGRVQLNGKQKVKRFNTWEEAQRWELEEKDQQKELKKQRIHSDCLTLHELVTQYLKKIQDNVTLRTWHEKKKTFKRLFEDVDPASPIEDVGYAQIEDHLDRINREVSGHRANKSRKNLVRLYNWGIKRRLLQAPNPWAIEKYGEDKKPRNVPSEQSFWKVVEVAEGQEKRLLLTYLYTAARMSEIFRLQPADINWNYQQLRLWTRKREGGGWEFDWIPMVDDLREVLKEQQRSYPFGEYVFQPQSWKYWTKHLMSDLCKEAGVAHFGYHGVRHLSASILDQANVSIKTIQLILRHKNAVTTSNYLHSLRGVKDDLGRAFKNPQLRDQVGGRGESEV